MKRVYAQKGLAFQHSLGPPFKEYATNTNSCATDITIIEFFKTTNHYLK